MEIRRGLMMGMASGANYIKGTFTPQVYGSYTLSFGKTFAKYMYFIEMTDDSKTELVNSGATGDRTYALCGKFPAPEINGATATNGERYAVIYRFNPSTSEYLVTVNTAVVMGADNSSLAISARYLSSGSFYVYIGYTYNYYIVEIK